MLLLVFLLVEAAQGNTMTTVQITNDTPLGTQNHPQLTGVWLQKGYGRILEIKEAHASFYHCTRSFCYKDPHKGNFNLAEDYSFSETNQDNSRLTLYRFDYKEKTREYPNRESFDRMDALPKHCVTSLARPKFSNAVFVFDLFWATFNEYYAFFEERGIDWDQVYRDYRPDVSKATDAETLFKILADILYRFNDGHVYLSWGDAHRFHNGGGPLLERLKAAFAAQSEVDEFSTYTWKWYNAILDGIAQEILAGNVYKELNDRLWWGHVNPDIGYLFLTHLTGFGPHGTTKPAQLTLLDKAFDTLLEAFRDKKAIIIDLSHNQGGFEAAGHLIASRFADRGRHVLNEYTRASGPEGGRAHYVTPSERVRFTGSIYLLTSEVTVSAGEVLALRLKTFPYVKHLGATTRGYLSSILNKPLPNGFHVTLSNEYWVPPSGVVYEAKGIRPDIGIEVFPYADLFGGHRRAVAKIIKRIETDLAR